MLLNKKETNKDDPKEHLIESYFDSSNVKKTLYIPYKQLLFIFFHNLVYSYRGVTMDLYLQFEKAESQGKYFISEIKKKPKEYLHFREFKLQEFEKQELKSLIESFSLDESN